MGRDVEQEHAVSGRDQFQSTRPAWGATTYDELIAGVPAISIHAPRMGRDQRSL